MRIAIVTDAWFPQVNGVVRTLDTVRRELESEGHVVEVIGPDRFRTIPCPTYPEIRLALFPTKRLADLLDAFLPDALHLPTEGPLGMAGKKLAKKRRWPFTTSFHTKFPEYLHARTGIPAAWSYAFLRRFHNAADRVMVATPSLEAELSQRGFRNIVRFSRGADLELFRPREPLPLDLPKPVFAYVGRVAVEKNIGAFLALDLPGSKLVVGDGPQREELQKHYPNAHFIGAKHGEELARAYSAADVFVFPSRTDTFGLVVLEALACGVPVAAYPVTGPRDILSEADQPVGALSEDLREAALAALKVDRAACRDHALRYSWPAAARQFLDALALIREEARA